MSLVPVNPAAPGKASRGNIPDLVDLHAWNRYCTLLQVFKVFGGIYVQEPDCCPASVAALVQLANNHPGHFPMGFAYGHLSSKAVAVADHTGRGLAAQALLEEFSSQDALNGNVSQAVSRSHKRNQASANLGLYAGCRSRNGSRRASTSRPATRCT